MFLRISPKFTQSETKSAALNFRCVALFSEYLFLSVFWFVSLVDYLVLVGVVFVDVGGATLFLFLFPRSSICQESRIFFLRESEQEISNFFFFFNCSLKKLKKKEV